MSTADTYRHARGTARTSSGRTVAWMSSVHPDLWEDEPVLRSLVTERLLRVAVQHGETLVEDSLELRELEVIPGLEHLATREITDEAGS